MQVFSGICLVIQLQENLVNTVFQTAVKDLAQRIKFVWPDFSHLTFDHLFWLTAYVFSAVYYTKCPHNYLSKNIYIFSVSLLILSLKDSKHCHKFWLLSFHKWYFTLIFSGDKTTIHTENMEFPCGLGTGFVLRSFARGRMQTANKEWAGSKRQRF